jgi:hypothetical protein
MSTPDELAATAYHEAGHAIARWHFGYPIDRVTITPAEDYAGAVGSASPLAELELDIDRSEETEQHMQQAVMVAFAGPEAQRRYDPAAFHGWQASVDYDEAMERLLWLGGTGERAMAICDVLSSKTKDLVEANWPSIEKLAAALLEHGELTSADVYGLLGTSPALHTS